MTDLVRVPLPVRGGIVEREAHGSTSLVGVHVWTVMARKGMFCFLIYLHTVSTLVKLSKYAQTY